jgi:hypothetical protein
MLRSLYQNTNYDQALAFDAKLLKLFTVCITPDIDCIVDTLYAKSECQCQTLDSIARLASTVKLYVLLSQPMPFSIQKDL